MVERLDRSGLQVDARLVVFVEGQALPGSGIGADAFWSGLAATLADLAPETLGKVSERRAAVMEWLESAERRPIGLPHDGETFQDADADEAADTLQKLNDAGYNVPQYAIDSLRAEAQADDPVQRDAETHK